MAHVEELKSHLMAKDLELERLRMLLHEHGIRSDVDTESRESTEDYSASSPVVDYLDKSEIERYSRQLLLPGFGKKGQLALRNKSVLVVGCGGLGSPVALYLAGAGIGRLGLVDHDIVEVNNLHRQILHSEKAANEQTTKAQSAADACRRLNGNIVCDVHHIALSTDNALGIITQYDIVVDATDNVATRYLLNDACVFVGRPLVSAGVLRFEGQLTVYNYNGSPCYRCIFPTPPPPETVSNCSDSGVLGPVVGVIGSMQAVEVIKLATCLGSSAAGRMILYDGLDCSVRCIRLRPRRKDCVVCGESPTIRSLINYEMFCGASATDKERKINILSDSERISVDDYAALISKQEAHMLVDVRSVAELDIAKLPTTTHNIPMDEFDKAEGCAPLLDAFIDYVRCHAQRTGTSLPVFVVCRRGNDSQLAVKKLQLYLSASVAVNIRDIVGGLHAWAKTVDPQFPVY